MSTVHSGFAFIAPASWRELVLPKEHGSWSLALEPLIYGLLVAPSGAGLGLALAVGAAFLVRRPLKIAMRDQRTGRRAEARSAMAACAASAAVLLLIPLWLSGGAWLVWLLPTLALSAAFMVFDLRNSGREGAAEIAGAAAFALLPAAFVILAGGAPMTATAAALIMLGRAVPTVSLVRTMVRGAKTGEWNVVMPLALAIAALVVGTVLWYKGDASPVVPVLFAGLMLRAIALVWLLRGRLRPRTLGMFEAASGACFVLIAGLA